MIPPVVVAYGAGVDSTAMLVGMHQRGERPDAILFADTGDEKPATYAYLPTMDAWLASVGFPSITVVKNARPKSGDKSLSEACIRTGYLPALAYGQHQCSIVWKLVPQQKWLKAWPLAQDAWLAGIDVVTCIGYDAGDRDRKRCDKAWNKAAAGFVNRYPLIEWGWDRERCIAEIQAAGLPVPMKSACFHCPSSKPAEIEWLRDNSPEQFARALAMEQAALPKAMIRKAEGKRWVKGLGRSAGSWAQFAREAA